MAGGKFIVLEGADYTGKSTVVTLLSEWLLRNSIDNLITRHPGATPVGVALRKLIKEQDVPVPPRAEGLIMAADNAAFIDSVLKPTLATGRWVIGDRNNYISGLVYQIMSGNSLEDLDKIQAATSPADQPKIDILFVLTADAEVRKNRRAIRNDGKPDRFEDRGTSYMDGIVRAYERLAEEHQTRLLKFVAATTTVPEPVPRIFYVDAGKPIGAVLDTITDVIKSLLLDPQQRQSQ